MEASKAETETEMETPDTSNFQNVAEMIQTLFQDSILVMEATCQALVLILRGGGDLRGIGLMEVL